MKIRDGRGEGRIAGDGWKEDGDEEGRDERWKGKGDPPDPPAALHSRPNRLRNSSWDSNRARAYLGVGYGVWGWEEPRPFGSATRSGRAEGAREAGGGWSTFPDWGTPPARWTF